MRPLIVLIVSLVSMALIFFLQHVRFEAPETTGLPFILYLMLIFGFLIFMAGKEFMGAWTSGKSDIQWTSFYMLAAALVVLTGFICLLEAFAPGWWGNVMGSRAGLIALVLMLICGLGWYIMPGTGKITLAGAKWPIAILGIISLIIFLGTAIGGGSSSEKDRIVSPRAYAPPPVPAPKWVTVAEKEFTPDSWNSADLGYTEVANLDCGKYKIIATGCYRQYFYNEEGGILREVCSDQGRYWNRLPKKLFPLPNKPFGIPIAKYDGKIIPINSEQEIQVEGSTPVSVSVNIPQEVTEFGHNVANNFRHNEGILTVRIKKII